MSEAALTSRLLRSMPKDFRFEPCKVTALKRTLWFMAPDGHPIWIPWGWMPQGLSILNAASLVDQTLRTSNRRIFAVGDCAATIQLARVADQEAHVAAENILAELDTGPQSNYGLPCRAGDSFYLSPVGNGRANRRGIETRPAKLIEKALPRISVGRLTSEWG